MITILAALAPVGIVIALGWWLRRRDFPGDAFWAPAERLTYFLLFPALLIDTLANAPLAALRVAPMALALALPLVAVAGLMLALRRHLAIDGPGFTSLFQGSIRLNAYVGLAAAFALYGEAGLTLASVALATFIPIVNVMCVAVLSRYARARPAGWREVGRAMVHNPLIAGCAVGIALNAAGIEPPAVINDMLDILGRAAMPFGVLCVGAGLSFAGVTGVRGGLAIVGAMKLVVLPALTALACAVLGVDALGTGIVVLFAALPTATSTYVLSRQMGGDSALMAQTVAITTVAAGVTMPVMLAILT